MHMYRTALFVGSASLSAILLTVPCLFALATLGILIMGLYTDKPAVPLPLVFGVAPLVAIVGLAISRFWLRCFPLNANGSRRGSILVVDAALLVLSVSLLIITCLALRGRDSLIGTDLESLSNLVFVYPLAALAIATSIHARVHLQPS